MARSSWLCPCGHRNEPTHRKCRGSSCARSRPKKRVPKHAITLRDHSHHDYAIVNFNIHGGDDYNLSHGFLIKETCGVCGRKPSETRRHDRDHDHRTGKPRGLACFRCNRELLRNTTLEEARLVVAYLERVENHYAREGQSA